MNALLMIIPFATGLVGFLLLLLAHQVVDPKTALGAFQLPYLLGAVVVIPFVR